MSTIIKEFHESQKGTHENRKSIHKSKKGIYKSQWRQKKDKKTHKKLNKLFICAVTILIIVSGLVVIFLDNESIMAESRLANTMKDSTIDASEDASGGSKIFQEYETDYETVVITKGMTMWELAIENAPSGRDPRAYIEEIKKVNRLDTAELRIGKVIKLPHSEEN